MRGRISPVFFYLINFSYSSILASENSHVFRLLQTCSCIKLFDIGNELVHGRIDCARKCASSPDCSAFEIRQQGNHLVCRLLVLSYKENGESDLCLESDIYSYQTTEQTAKCEDLITSTSMFPKITTDLIVKRDCAVNAALVNEDLGETWLFSPGWVHKYNNVKDITSGPFTSVETSAIFPGSPEPVTAAYHEDGQYVLIHDQTVLLYDKTHTKFTSKRSIYHHFRSDIPKNIEAVLRVGNNLQIFTKLNVFFIEDKVTEMTVVQFKSDSDKNPYRTDDRTLRLEFITAAAAVDADVLLFFDNNQFYLYKNNGYKAEWLPQGRVAC